MLDRTETTRIIPIRNKSNPFLKSIENDKEVSIDWLKKFSDNSTNINERIRENKVTRKVSRNT